MEKQLLFLLDWDLRIRPEDLYCHLEPFLAPIREYQILEEQARMQRLREKEIYQQYPAQSYSPYVIDSYSSHSRSYTSSSSSSRGASRTPSLSPPSRSSTSSSSPDTESLDELYESTEELYVQPVEAENGTMVVHIQAPELHPKASLSRLQSYEEKPAKKARTGGTGGNFFSRLLNGTTQRVGAY